MNNLNHYSNPRSAPTFMQHANTVKNKDMQPGAPVDAAVSSGVQVDAPAPTADYTISVDQVREHFREKGLPKSKDTIQRWCRAGDLDCRKQGLLNRYFTTETSLLALEQKLLPDLIAENSNHSVPVKNEVQVDAPANAAVSSDMQVHEADNAPAHSGMQEDAADELTRMQPDAPAHSDHVEIAMLRAENTGLRSQLKQATETADFYKEEIVSSRGQRGDVVKIAEQMLGTLETIAIGGKIMPPQEPPKQADPMHVD